MKTLMKFMTAVALLLMAACSILPETQSVQLLDPRPDAPAVARQGVDWTLNVARPESDPARDSTRVLVRTGQGQLQVHASARWVAAAPELVRTRLVRYLRDSQRIGQVSAGAAGLDRTLALDLRAFELVETGDGRLKAEMRLEARLYDSRTAELVARKRFEARQSVGGAEAAEIVGGFETVLSEVIQALADWLTA